VTSSMVTDTLAGSQYSFEKTRYLMKRHLSLDSVTW
jgi:hypothetical protein